ncbi:hypothetical protein [Paenibacillus sp. FSL L8-0709]|uniref:hypothetical protein n=1 Tax=Paenibacillus sp. FSL L8-0709 TaxID=2975312 RepID=UPI0030FB6255
MGIITELNRNEYCVHLDYLRQMVALTIAEGKSLRKELDQILVLHGEKVDLHSNEEVVRYIKLLLKAKDAKEIKITNVALDRWFEQTKDAFFLKLKNYIRCHDRYKKTTAFINSITGGKDKRLDEFMNSNLKTTTIHPEFSKNRSGGISMSQPVMPFSIKEMMGLLYFNVAIRFESNDDILGFLRKYDDIIWRDGMGRRLLVSGEVVYAQMIIDERDIFPFTEGEDELGKLIDQFNLEYHNYEYKMTSRIHIIS